MDTQTLHDLVARKLFLDDRVALLEADLAEAKSERWRIVSQEIPRLMIEAGVREATTEDGVVISVGDEVLGSIPKDPQRAAQALRWLRENGYGDLIKNQVTAVFARGEDDLADRYAQQLVQEGITVEKREAVHPQTLLAWARRELKDGNVIDLEELGLQQVTMAKVKQQKRSG